MSKSEEQSNKSKDNDDLNQVVRGCQDYNPPLWNKIQYISQILRQTTSNMGIEEIETPTMEYKSLLLNKYGDEAETKLIYELQNGKSALRYDLTVPFTRYVMNNGLEDIKRLQIGRVYRRDEPYPSQGRFCEFYQGDIDIVGNREVMVAESEILKLIDMVMEKIGLSNYVIRINFRQNLEKMFQKVGVKTSQTKYFKSLCTSIDKLDKHDWEYVKTELKNKNLNEGQLSQLNDMLFNGYIDDSIKEQYQLLDKYIQIMKIKNVQFDTTLARGLDYYTGLIYEVVFPDTSIGSVIAGGRYDKLIFKTKKKSRMYIPAIGVSFGISRLSLLINDIKKETFKIYLVADDKYLDKKLELMTMLLDEEYQVEYMDKSRKNIKEINYGIKNDFNFVLIYGENGDDMVCVKKNDQSADKIVPIEKVIDAIQNFDEES
jgi:histidyl-tRNA synthetase